MSNLDEKLLSGYWYRVTPNDNSPSTPDGRQLTMQTGVGGAKLLIDTFREKDMPDDWIATQIEVFTHDRWVPLSDVKITKKS